MPQPNPLQPADYHVVGMEGQLTSSNGPSPLPMGTPMRSPSPGRNALTYLPHDPMYSSPTPYPDAIYEAIEASEVQFRILPFNTEENRREPLGSQPQRVLRIPPQLD
jgi:hypothetical protein